MKLIFILLAIFLISCSTRSGSVTKNLPVIPEGALKKPTSEVGSLNLKSDKLLAIGYTFSAFLWPMVPNLDTLAKDIALDSRQIDVLTKEFRDLNSRLERETTRWTSLRCNADTDKPETRTELEDCEKILDEKDLHLACVCIVSNQPVLIGKMQASLQNRIILGQKITERIEPSNWLLGGTVEGSGVGSKVSVSADDNGMLKASVRLENFGKLGVYYKSIDVPTDTDLDECGLPKETTPSQAGRIINTKYDIQTKLLAFTVISKLENDAPGTRYDFMMERGFVPEGSPELTRFKGDVLKKNCTGQVMGFGSAKFDGIWTF